MATKVCKVKSQGITFMAGEGEKVWGQVFEVDEEEAEYYLLNNVLEEASPAEQTVYAQEKAKAAKAAKAAETPTPPVEQPPPTGETTTTGETKKSGGK